MSSNGFLWVLGIVYWVDWDPKTCLVLNSEPKSHVGPHFRVKIGEENAIRGVKTGFGGQFGLVGRGVRGGGPE